MLKVTFNGLKTVVEGEGTPHAIGLESCYIVDGVADAVMTRTDTATYRAFLATSMQLLAERFKDTYEDSGDEKETKEALPWVATLLSLLMCRGDKSEEKKE